MGTLKTLDPSVNTFRTGLLYQSCPRMPQGSSPVYTYYLPPLGTRDHELMSYQLFLQWWWLWGPAGPATKLKLAQSWGSVVSV